MRICCLNDFAVNIKTSFSDAIFTTTTRGKPAIRIGSYRYNRHSCCKGPKIRWLCQKWHMGCRASVFTYDSEIIAEKNEHNHWFVNWRLKCFLIPTYLVSISYTKLLVYKVQYIYVPAHKSAIFYSLFFCIHLWFRSFKVQQRFNISSSRLLHIGKETSPGVNCVYLLN